VTYDEFGGQWDHVSPPGQGTHPGAARRSWARHPHPGAVLSAVAAALGVDHTVYDTTSIMATIEHSFGLEARRDQGRAGQRPGRAVALGRRSL
jgi:phospholipase C